MSRFRVLLLGFCALLFAAATIAVRIGPALQEVAAHREGKFEEGGGWYPGEPLETARPVRAWGSWCDDDANTGTLTLGPFRAPTALRLAVSGYPAQPGIQLYAEHAGTRERVKIASPDVGERWQIVEQRLPPAWTGQPMTIVAVDRATGLGGWVGITEPLRGGAYRETARLVRSFALWAGVALVIQAAFAAGFRSSAPNEIPVPTGPSRADERGWPARTVPWLLGAGALAPLFWCRAPFSELWWFGDEWDQLDLIARLGFWRWTVLPFGENLVPLFKSLWGGLALAGRGSYMVMLVALWLTHAANTALLARLLRRRGFGWPGTCVAAALFGLTVAHIEILGWSIQWSNALATLFLLLALEQFFADAASRAPQIHGGARSPSGREFQRDSHLLGAALPETQAGSENRPHLAPRLRERPAILRAGLLLGWSAASALTFVRGILVGPVLAFGELFLRRGAVPPLRIRLRVAALCLLPSVAAVMWMFVSAPGNHHALGHEGLLRHAIEFAAWFWAAVPFHRLAAVSPWSAQTTLVLGVLKAGLVLWALVRTRGEVRHVLALFLLFDLGNAALLGLGRHQTGLQNANSSRYYYSSLICIVPFLAAAFDAWLAPVRAGAWRTAIAGVVVLVAAGFVIRGWPHEAEMFAQWRGRNTRQILLQDQHPPAQGAVPGIPFLATARAKELIELYHLH